MAAAWKKRLQKELCELQKKPPNGMKIHRESNLTKWIIELDGAQGTLYENEKFQLQFKFGSRYPFDSPEVRTVLFRVFILFLHNMEWKSHDMVNI
ncbi:ubiquitin-conjugating enzyme E2 W-like [Actinia tenebrosa]|uniref:Ubiquitin-conjugating enzyme E2 W-like n=1 Tax=Actinia tenebrosa TaxID=6105 RepID=A0A6P8I124_ACTTE|nr:ubiquitin-conjugating enzyme E2 W-like [Actinia tenebrosa]